MWSNILNACAQEGGGRPGSGKKGQGKAARAGSVDGAAAPAPLVPSYAVLACEYHISMVAGLSLISASTPQPSLL